MSDRAINTALFRPSSLDRDSTTVEQRAKRERARPEPIWTPQRFAREQIRGLVRQAFLSPVNAPVRQVVFSALERGTDVPGICRLVAEELASSGTVAVAESPVRIAGDLARVAPMEPGRVGLRNVDLRQTAMPLASNVWFVLWPRSDEACDSTASIRSHLSALRREFDYSLVQAAHAAASQETTAMAQLADGIILVLSAHRTRRATAQHVKERMESASARVLGCVLNERRFPIPEKIYSFL
jgi:hypothetical protein